MRLVNREGSMEICYKLLPQEQWERLRPIFDELKMFMPPAPLAVASIAESEGQLIGILVLQMVPYAGPLWIHPDWRGKVDYVALKKTLDKVFPQEGNGKLLINGYVVMTGDERIAKMAEISGMRRLDCITLFQGFGEANVLSDGLRG